MKFNNVYIVNLFAYYHTAWSFMFVCIDFIIRYVCITATYANIDRCFLLIEKFAVCLLIFLFIVNTLCILNIYINALVLLIYKYISSISLSKHCNNHLIPALSSTFW